MLLNLSDGKSITDAYKEYYIAALIGSRKWRRDLIHHWTTTLGSPLTTINGKQYWGGAYDLNHLNESPDMVKMADFFGIDKQGKDDIHAAGVSGDTDWVHAKFRPKPKTDNPYNAENVGYMFEHGVAAKAAQSGLSTVTFKSVDMVVPCVFYTRTIIDVNGATTSNTVTYTTSYLAESSTSSSTTQTTGTPPDEVTTITTTTIITGLDSPYNHPPSPLLMKSVDRATNAYHPNLSITNTLNDTTNPDVFPIPNALKTSGLGELFCSVYSVCGFLEQFCTHSVSIVLKRTEADFLSHPVSWVFETHHSFTMGNYSWMSSVNVRDFLYPSIVIGASTSEDYFTFVTTRNMKGGDHTTITGKNLSGKIMDVIDPVTTGNTLLTILAPYISPYPWAVIIDGKLWFEYEHVMAMEIKEFMHTISLHLDIDAGAAGGFFATFVGQFVGGLLKFAGKLIEMFFAIVEICDIIIKPILIAVLWTLNKLGIICKTDQRNFLKAYKIIRNHVALAVVTFGMGEYIEAANIGIEASKALVEAGLPALTGGELALISASDLMQFELMNLSVTTIIRDVLELAIEVATGLNAPDVSGAANTAAAAVKGEITNPIGVVYESGGDIDYVDAIYMRMSDTYGDFMEDALSLVYS